MREREKDFTPPKLHHAELCWVDVMFHTKSHTRTHVFAFCLFCLWCVCRCCMCVVCVLYVCCMLYVCVVCALCLVSCVLSCVVGGVVGVGVGVGGRLLLVAFHQH